MKKSLPIYLFTSLAGFVFIFSGCTGAYYDPYIVDLGRQKENSYRATSKPSTPLLSQKNDFNFEANFLSADKHNAGQFDVSFAPVNHLGLVSSVSFFSNKSGLSKSDLGHYELGAGYFKEISPTVLFEAYTGLGGGKISNEHHTGNSSIKTSNYFIQPTIALKSKNNAVHFAFASKFNSTKFKINRLSFDQDREPFVTEQMLNIAAHPTHVFWEPAFLFRAGKKSIAFEAGYTFSKDLSGNEIYGSKGSFSIGMFLHVNASRK